MRIGIVDLNRYRRRTAKRIARLHIWHTTIGYRRQRRHGEVNTNRVFIQKPVKCTPNGNRIEARQQFLETKLDIAPRIEPRRCTAIQNISKPVVAEFAKRKIRFTRRIATQRQRLRCLIGVVLVHIARHIIGHDEHIVTRWAWNELFCQCDFFGIRHLFVQLQGQNATRHGGELNSASIDYSQIFFKFVDLRELWAK